MSTPLQQAGQSDAGSRSTTFLDRLKEIDLFFDGNDKVHQTMRRIVSRLEEAGITYALVGAMAVNAHGARRTTDDVGFLLTEHGLDRFRAEFLGSHVDVVEGRPRRFIDRQNGVTIDILVTGHYPGRGQPGPIAFPDPDEASQRIDDVTVLTLPQLVQLKLAARRYYDLADVVFLIDAHNLDESFAEQLHPSVHRDYIECLDEKRREDDYIAREG